MSTLPNVDLAELRRRLNVLDMAQQLVTGLRRRGREWVACCPFHQEKTPSFTIVPAKDFYHCFGCGAHGDAIGLYMKMKGLRFEEAIEDLARDVGLGDTAVVRPPRQRHTPAARMAPKQQIERDEDRARRYALEIWRASQPAAATLVETYLRSRSIDLEAIGGVPASLRFHPGLDSGPQNDRRICPVMVAGVQAPDGKVVAVHRTFLAPDGRGKARIAVAKMMLAPLCHGAVRLSALAGDMLGTTEGIETGLSVLSELRRAGHDVAIWVALSLTHLSGAGNPAARLKKHPTKRGATIPTWRPDLNRPGMTLPPGIKNLIICADGDSDPIMTRALVKRATHRFQHGGVNVREAWPHARLDWNDIAQACATQNFAHVA